MGEETGLYYYGARYYNPRESVWLSTDPLSGYNPIFETEHYINGQHNNGVFNSKNHNTYGYCYQNPVVLIDPNGKQTFFIHGTSSNSSRWTKDEGPRAVKAIMRITNSKYYNTGFNWYAPLTNDQNYRLQAAHKLKDYVLKHRVEGQEITLVGHSHGGNVAIQASKMISEATGEKVNLITIATPAYNKLSKWSGNRENPESYKNYINDHIALWNKVDGVSGGMAGDDYFKTSSITTNIESDVSKDYKSTQILDAHSFDVEKPEILERNIDNGKIRTIKEIKK